MSLQKCLMNATEYELEKIKIYKKLPVIHLSNIQIIPSQSCRLIRDIFQAYVTFS